MTVALTCACGARLEIDEKFAGQVINCPDCNRALETAPPLPEAPLTSGYALASLVLGLVGAFTLIGTIAAIVCGALGLAQIRREPARVGGKRFAQAGIALGITGTLVTLVALWSSEMFRLDGWLRTIEWAGKYVTTPEEIDIDRSGGLDPGRSGTIKRPSPAWVRLKAANKEGADDLDLVNLWEDAYIVCLTRWLDQQGLTLENCRQEGQQAFLQSDLVTKVLGQSPANSPPPVGHDRERKQLPGTETQEFLLDIRLGGLDRTFLIRVLRDGNRLNIVAGGTRSSRFPRLQPEIVKGLDSYRVEK